MRIWKLYPWLMAMALTMLACTDDDSFGVSPSGRLTFSVDTVRMDTVFSKVPTATKSFWVSNHSGDGIRCTQIRLEEGNQSGYRINVDGTYLGAAQGFQTQHVEIRKNDSICVFVELTSPMNGREGLQRHEDELVFTLESGVEQRVPLCAYTWDAELLHDVVIKRDTVFEGSQPIVVYGGITIETSATLRIMAGKTLYFHADAGMDVYGTLITEGTAENNVVLRGDRTDRMFDYLPYDLVSGQWRGIVFHSSSYNNKIDYTDIHSTFTAISCDSSDVESQKLIISNSIVHNCQGTGILARNCRMDICNSQITNTLDNCLSVMGGNVTMNHCTLGQFYPFDSNRGAALYIEDSDKYPLETLLCTNSLITGYAKDMVESNLKDTTTKNYRFVSSILRMPTKTDTLHYQDVLFEQVEDTVGMGDRHFRLVDINTQHYDFHLSEKSVAIDKASPLYSLPIDRDGEKRDERPDIGCYEYTRRNE